MKKDRNETGDDAAIMGLAEQQGEAKYSLCENAAVAAKGVKECEDAADRRLNRLKNHATKLTLVSSAVLATLIYTWHIGRPLEAALGLVKSGKGGADLYEENVKLKGELAMSLSRQEGQRIKLNWKGETQKIFIGFVTGRTNYLESALTINPDRPNGFPFTDWNSVLKEQLLGFAISSFHIDVLLWVTQQPDWYTNINDGLVGEIILILKDYAHDTTDRKEVL
jgi:hypothetical protein